MNRTHILAALLLTIALAGCQRDEQLTLDQWKAAHPWCDNELDVTQLRPADQANGVRVLVYQDALPSIHPVTGHYEREHGLHLLRVRDGIVIARRWYAGNSFAE